MEENILGRKSSLVDLPTEMIIEIFLFCPTHFILHLRYPFFMGKRITKILTESKYFWICITNRFFAKENSLPSSTKLGLEEIRKYCFHRGRMEGIHRTSFPTFKTRHEIFDGNKGCDQSFDEFFDETESTCLLFCGDNNSTLNNGGEKITGGFETFPEDHGTVFFYDSSNSRKDYFKEVDPPREICFKSLDFLFHFSWRGMTATENSTTKYQIRNTEFTIWSPKNLKSMKIEVEKYFSCTETSTTPFYTNVNKDYYDISIKVDGKDFFTTVKEKAGNGEEEEEEEEKEREVKSFTYTTEGIYEKIVSMFSVGKKEIENLSLNFGDHGDFALIWSYIFKDFVKWMKYGGSNEKGDLFESSVYDLLTFYEISCSDKLEKL